ncbi:MAG TPA: L-seryl-tRNA(Sec) selenium transferase [Verrucomicrobiae bacterium]|nr:L-seryl-tRNA(Sec) selenium transferase [Verrucomicrobiae bacterium]
MSAASKQPAKLAVANRAALLRQIPSVDELLGTAESQRLIARAGRPLVVGAIRTLLADLRKAAGNGTAVAFNVVQILQDAARNVECALSPSLQVVINATGVVLHTNLGRAPLSHAAIEHIAATAAGYSNLEYEISVGKRGKRDTHTGRLLAELSGAEAAIVVNNNAAAVFLILNTFAKDAEVIVSRGELIEIGDGFRIPEIMSASGARLREVGTTNRTRIADYQRAINDHTRLLLRVHPSNFKIIGFTNRPELAELVALGRKTRIPVFEDLGSGCLTDLSAAGIGEPVVRTSLAAGADIVSFSGDKLLGGPQAGVIAGRKKYVERIRRNPLFRALRVDKLTIAALEATLSAYQRGALDEIPALHMIRMSTAEIEQRSRAFAEKLRARLSSEVHLEIRNGSSVIGGGSTPEQKLPTKLIAIRSARHSAAQLEELLRKPQSGPSVIARIEKNLLVFDLRTVFSEEEASLLTALGAALA